MKETKSVRHPINVWHDELDDALYYIAVSPNTSLNIRGLMSHFKVVIQMEHNLVIRPIQEILEYKILE